MQRRNYECEYCGQGFVHEERFLRHRCKYIKRHEQFNTALGQAAWFYYQEWMKAQKRRVPKSRSFIHSRYFNTFIRFAQFVKQVAMPKPETFVWLMKEYDIPPSMWTHDQVYAKYLEYLDHKCDPYQLAQVTINTLFDVADAAGCDVQQVFEQLTPNEVIQLLRQRRLSPWILLVSQRFTQFFKNHCNSDQRITIESIIRPSHWKQKFADNPQTVEHMKQYARELNL